MTGRILIIEPENPFRARTRSWLAQDFYKTFTANTGQEGIALAKKILPDIIFLDMNLPDITGTEALSILKEHPETRHSPVLMLATDLKEGELLKALKSGAEDYLEKPVDKRILRARTSNLMRVKHLIDETRERSKILGLNEDEISPNEMLTIAKQNRALLCCSNLPMANAQKAYLEANGCTNISISLNENRAFEQAKHEGIRGYIIYERMLHEGNGLRLIANLKSEWKLRRSVIIFISESNESTGLRALDLGASDYLIAPYNPNELLLRIHTQLRRKIYEYQLTGMAKEQIKLTNLDALTECYNRRYLDQHLPKVIERSQKNDLQFAVLMLDIDHFKNLNDQHGHDFGDYVLKGVSETLRNCIRGSDILVRYGGEEFIIILQQTPETKALTIAERIRSKVAGKSYYTEEGINVQVTISIGVHIVDPGFSNIQKIMKAPDVALYEAKRSGRNRVQLYKN